MSKGPEEPPTGRDRLNRSVGLYAYALSAVLAGLLAYFVFDELRAGRSLTKELGWLALAAAALFGLGYSSSRKKS